MNKQAQIEAKLAEEINIGDNVVANIIYQTQKTLGKGKKTEFITEDKESRHTGVVKEIFDHPKHGRIFVIETNSTSIPYDAQLSSKELGRSTLNLFKAEFVTKSIFDCGANPFKPKLDIRFVATSIEGLFSRDKYRGRNGYDEQELEVLNNPNDFENKDIVGCLYGGINFNPKIIDANGNEIGYQRDLVWSTEQKQLLIHSIYNGIEIGKFIFKYNSWAQIRKEILKTGRGYDWECIDGKQRYNAILEFAQNKFPDEFGNYWRDLSPRAQMEFRKYNNLAVGEVGENTSAKDILKIFLTLNFTGTPISREHIEYVQSIKI